MTATDILHVQFTQELMSEQLFILIFLSIVFLLAFCVQELLDQPTTQYTLQLFLNFHEEIVNTTLEMREKKDACSLKR